jgi:hypothetical protein
MKEQRKGRSGGAASRMSPTPWSVRLTGGTALVGSLALGASAGEVLLATAAGMTVAQVARSRVTVKRLRRDDAGKPEQELRSLTGQLP